MALIDSLERDGIRGRISAGAEIAPFTWFRVGGPADCLLVPQDEDDLAAALAVLPVEVPVTVLGLASNTLVRDGGVPGLVIRLIRGFSQAQTFEDGTVTAGTGMADARFARVCADAGIGGFSFFRGIPGSLGGALRMNAGAHGGETKDNFVSARAVTRNGQIVTLTAAQMGFHYRHTDAPLDLIFTSVTFKGTPGVDPLVLKAQMDEVSTYRETHQPTKDRTGGSTFKNPDPPGTPNQRSAWKHVDAAGCRGLVIGDAIVSEKHCNFLINRGSATAADIERLGETVRARVRAVTGVDLDWEIKRIGRFAEGAEVSPFTDYA